MPLLPAHLLFMFVAATARMSVPCMSTWLISSLLFTWRSHAPAKLTPVGSSRMVTTGRGAEEFAHSKSRTSSCKGHTAHASKGACALTSEDPATKRSCSYRRSDVGTAQPRQEVLLPTYKLLHVPHQRVPTLWISTKLTLMVKSVVGSCSTRVNSSSMTLGMTPRLSSSGDQAEPMV
jgi:hypothetical protein